MVVSTLGPTVEAVAGAAERLDAVERAASLAYRTLGDTEQYRAIVQHLVSRLLEDWPSDEVRDATVLSGASP